MTRFFTESATAGVGRKPPGRELLSPTQRLPGSAPGLTFAPLTDKIPACARIH